MKKEIVRRTFAWVLTLVMALSVVPFGVFAEGAEQPEAQVETGETGEKQAETPKVGGVETGAVKTKTPR